MKSEKEEEKKKAPQKFQSIFVPSPPVLPPSVMNIAQHRDDLMSSTTIATPVSYIDIVTPSYNYSIESGNSFPTVSFPAFSAAAAARGTVRSIFVSDSTTV
jgi:hypothetical protein